MAALKEVSGFAGATSRDALRRLGAQLAAVGIETPAEDARRLVAAALAATAEDLLRAPERRLTDAEGAALTGFALRRAAREPVSRILGRRDFYGRMFHVTKATLDPRSCTETVIEAALEIAAEEGWREQPIRILDVGTGSGCLLLTLLAELPLATGLGTDISDEALVAAEENARRLGVASRSRFAAANFLEGIDETFDLLVANPPYIASADIAGLEPEVREHDPLAALDGGADGLDAYRAIARELKNVVQNGWAVLEVGYGQSVAVAGLLERSRPGHEQSAVRTWHDLGGHLRAVAVKTQS